MAFQPGNKASQGRPRGSKNLVSDKMKKFLSECVFKDMELLKADWRKLTPSQRLTLVEKFSRYVMPALGQTSIDINKIDPEKFNEDQMPMLIDNINLKAV